VAPCASVGGTGGSQHGRRGRRGKSRQGKGAKKEGKKKGKEEAQVKSSASERRRRTPSSGWSNRGDCSERAPVDEAASWFTCPLTGLRDSFPANESSR